MSNNYGDGVSRVLDPATTQYLSVIWQSDMPPLDSEWNLVGDLSAGWDRQKALLGSPSGWFGNDINPSKDYQTNPTWSNWFQFGRQRTGDKQSIMWAVVNGWLVPVTGTKTGDPPGSPDDVSIWNRILLDPPPGTAGDSRADFVFLEVWKARVSPYPSTLNKPNGSAVYRYGNVEGGFSYLADDLIDPEIGEATTERVQLQYRIRVVRGLINLATNPDGFDPSVVKAQGTQATPPSVGGYTFTNMREELGDPGLWRAGDGLANALGTVDGYVYAIPICVVFRRNSILWAGEPAQNLNGAFNRNQLAVDRTGTATFSTIPALAAGMTSSALTATLSSATSIPLPAAPSSQVLIRIDEELMTYSSISGTSITLTARGVNGTAAATHNSGAVITVVSSRPDGLYADQVTLTDILDLRHAVNPAGFNYTNLLRSNLDKLLKGQLRANWKKSGADPRGIYLIYQDKISATPAISLGITALDAPDHIRTIFSDAAVQQPVEVIGRPATWSSPPTFPLAGQQTWDLQIQVDILAQAETQRWTVGDQLRIPVVQFKSGVLPTDADQIRILNDQPASGIGNSFGTYQFIDATQDYVRGGVEIGDTLVIPSGDAIGSYTVTSVTTSVLTVSTLIPTASSTYVVRKGVGSVQIRVEGQSTPLAQHQFSLTPANPTPTDNLTITLLGGNLGSTDANLYITTHVQYGGGRGLSRRPDSIQGINLLNPSSRLLYRSEYTQAGTYKLNTAWAPLWSKYRSDTYKSLLPVTSEAFADLGSKTVAITPFQEIQFPVPTYLTGDIMPTTAFGAPDPLGLFYHSGGNERYIILPRHLVPGWGAVQVPILPPASAGTFHSGINFMLMSREGMLNASSNDPQHNQQFINYFITGGASCAIFSTRVLDGATPPSTIYNTSYLASYQYAGMRFFNDDPSISGALSTARGLGRQGLELPPFYGIARLFAVYEASDYRLNNSHFNIPSGTGDRSLRSSGATNLLRDNFEGTTFWIEKDDNGDSTFILNAEVIDISKSPTPITDFASGDYVIEACVFGFGRGAFDLNQPFRLAVSSGFTGSLVVGPNAVLPGPLATTDTALINYSRTPYQGDAWGTTTTFADKGYTPGPLTSANAYRLSSTSLSPTGLTRPNQKPLEVLASVGFITTLGTGRLSGDFSLSNAYDIRNVGYEDPTDPVAPYPPLTGTAARPLVKSGALGSLSNYGDLEANPEYLGCTERLPLGSLYRDKDFHGSRFSDELSSPFVYVDTAGVGSGVAGLAMTNELDQTEVLAMPASVSAGVPGDVLVMVDGSTSDYTQLLNYRTNRGGSVFVGSGDRPGGEVFATYSRLMGSGKGTRVLVGRAFLVRNAPTLVGAVQVSGGDELMLAVTTEVMELGTTPIEAMLLIGTNGSGEGYAAADLYRIEGHPLLANHTFYDVDPNTIELPRGKTIAQITAPSPAPAIPIGAASTVYASDGIRNFWTNIPALTGGTFTNLSVLNNTTLGTTGTSFAGGNLFFSQYALPNIQQVAAAPGVAGRTLNIYSQAPTPNSTSVITNGGWLWLSSGDVTSATAGLRAGSGLAIVRSGNHDANTVGITGEARLTSGTNYGTGNTGAVQVACGQAYAGSGGVASVTGGSASGTTGNGGAVRVTGGYVLNSGNPSGIGGSVSLQGGGSEAASGSGGDIEIASGSHPITPGQIYFLIGGLIGTRYANISNANLVVGPNGVAGNYGVLFSPTTTNPIIGQENTAGSSPDLTIRAASVAPLSVGHGGSVRLLSGTGTLYNGSVELATPVGTRLTVNDHDVTLAVGDILFNETVEPRFYHNPDTSGTHAGRDMVFTAQHSQIAGSGWQGGSLYLNAGNGDGDGGGIILTSGGANSGFTGDIIVSTGAGTSVGQIFMRVGGFEKLTIAEEGIRVRNQLGSGHDNGIAFEASGNLPPAVGIGATGVLYTTPGGNLQFRSNTGQIANLAQELAHGTLSGSISVSTTSATYVLVASYDITIPGGSRVGDYLEGEVFCNTLTTVAEVPCSASLMIDFTENAAQINPHAVGLGYTPILGTIRELHSLEFSCPLSGAGHPTISINLWVRSDGTATNVALSNRYGGGNNLWARYRLIRPAV